MSEDTQPLLDDEVVSRNPCGCTPGNPCRRLISNLTTSLGFDIFILLVIIANCVMMASESPLDPPGTAKAELIDQIGFVFNCIFTVEMFLKITAMGLGAYLSDGWNLLDVTVVSTAWAPLIFPGVGNYSAIRAVRVLRALRTVNRIPSLKKIISALLSSIPDLGNVAVLFCFFLFLFGIAGVTLFQGALHKRCTVKGSDEWVDDGAICGVDDDCDAGQTCEFYDVNPANGALSFDHCLWAFVTIFQAVSLEGWVDQMYMLSITTVPWLTALYYITLVVIGAMFITNLFLAVIFEAFLKSGDLEESSDEDKERIEDPTNFEMFVYFLIMGNTVSMCAEYYGESPEYSAILNLLNIVFTIVFSLEMIGKIMYRGSSKYFEQGWNTFDFVVTWASIIDLALDAWGHDTEFLRALRVARVLRLLRLNSQMARFEKTFKMTFSPMINMAGVLFLIIVVFSMLGMELFGGKLGEDPPRTNFDYFGNAFVTTFVVCSGENWNDVFSDSLMAGSPVTSVLFFLALFIIGNYMLVNLFVAIICWGWDSAVEEKPSELSPAEEEEIQQLRLRLSKETQALGAKHAELMQTIQELITDKALGFSTTFGSRLMSRMMSLFRDFTSTVESAEQKRAHQLRDLAGVTLAFTSLVGGLISMLDDPNQATPEVALLCEYWDSEHARITGAVGTGSSISTLQLALKRYITTITANKTLMKEVSEMRMQQREIRVPRPDPIAPGASRADKNTAMSKRAPGSQRQIKPSAPDPLGADYLPLKMASPGGACMRQLRALVIAPAFGNFIILCILCSSAALAFDMPTVLPGSPTANTLELLDYLFTSIFLVEMVLKIVALGAFQAPDGYFLSGWNILDSFIVTTSVISLLAADVESLSVIRTLRVARVLRPLRVIQRYPGLRQVVSSLFRAMPGVWNVSQVCMLVTVVYARFLMQFLMGRMGSCNDESIADREQCEGVYTNEDGEQMQRWWGNDDIGNFDNIGAATLTLFEMSTLEMWPDLMFRAMDSNPEEKGMALAQDQHPWMAVYIILWIVLSAFFLINLFVGVVLENFNAIREEEDGSGLMDDKQKEWTRTIQTILTIRPEKALRPPGGKGAWASFRRKTFMLVQGDSSNPDDREKTIPVAFEKFIITLVLLNVCSMAITWYGQPGYMYTFAEVADVFFTVAFTLEALLKISGLGLRQYLMSPWNCFDAILVTGALIADVLQSLESIGIQVDPALLRMLRIFRIARLLRLMKVSGGLNRLITTMAVSIPALGNVGLLLFLFMYIYTILGIELFHNLPLNGDFINDDANFATFGTAMMTLFRCITGESYNGIMHDAMITEEYSAPGRCSNADGNCGKPYAAVVYFVSFFILESMVMLNLIVAVVLDSFAEEEKAEEMKLKPGDMDQFIEAWKELDREATSFMPTKELRRLLFMLKWPNGFADYKELYGVEPQPRVVTERLRELAIPDRDGKLAFHDVLEAMGRLQLGDIELPPGSEAEKKLRQQYGDVLKATNMHNTDVSKYSSDYIFAVIRMQAAFRRRKAFRQRHPKEAKAAAKAAKAAITSKAKASPALGRPAAPASQRPTPPGSKRGKTPTKR